MGAAGAGVWVVAPNAKLEDGVVALPAPPNEKEGVCFVSLDTEADAAGVFGCPVEPKAKEGFAVVSWASGAGVEVAPNEKA